MSDSSETQNEPSSASVEQNWGASLAAVVCERCDWGFLIPEAVEFRQAGVHRLHDRVRYRRTSEGWVRERLAR